MSDEPQRPTSDDRAAWKAWWTAQDMPWRTEPEIPGERQAYLDDRRYNPRFAPNIEQGLYPFKDIELARADVEWLLATHENGLGPVDWGATTARQRIGLDLRGANLAGADLHELPLSRMRGGLARRPATPRVTSTSVLWPSGGPPPVPKNAVPFPFEWGLATAEQRRAAAVILDGANLTRAHLEGAVLTGASLHETNLYEVSMSAANLCNADLRGATLTWVDLTRADLREVHLELADLETTLLDAADMRRAFFDGGTLLAPHFGSPATGTARLADVQWGGASLGQVFWKHVIPTGDEQEARRRQAPDGSSKGGRVGEFEEAVRAYRQIASALKAQGLNEDADRFAYRAQLLQRRVFFRQGQVGQWLFSLLLGMLSGYGYRLRRILITYVLTLVVFAVAFFAVGLWQGPVLAPHQAFLVSLTAVHGRVFFEQFGLNSLLSWVAAIESVVGIVIEGVFVAMLVQRFFAR